MSEQKPTVKISKKFKNVLMKLKIDYGFKDLEELIKKMYEIILKYKLKGELNLK